MKHQTRIGLGIILTLLMISSTYVVATSIEQQTDSDIPGEIDFNKQVWNEELEEWTESLNVDLGDTARFKITMTYYGVSALHHIQVFDILPDEGIDFIFDASSVTFTNAPEVETEIDGNVLCWMFENYTLVLEDNDTFTIEFEIVNITGELGTYINTATFTASECLLYQHEGSDTATIVLRERIDVDKLVWDGEAWVDVLEGAHKDDIIQFQITITYYGPYSIKCMIVQDWLPGDYLVLAPGYPISISTTGVADYPRITVSEDNTSFILEWTNQENLFLKDKESVTITFSAQVIIHSDTTVYNEACAMAWTCLECDPLDDCDTATVVLESLEPTFEKSVWNGNTWADHADVIVGDTVRFQLKLTYRGNYYLNGIEMIDFLPCVLIYAGNANIEPYNVSEDNKIIKWNLYEIRLNDSESVVVEFDALVTGVTGCGIEGINIGQTTAIECDPTLEFEDTANITSIDNVPPSRPILDGDTSGRRREELTFTVLSDNYQEDDVWYYIDWGDETTNGWIGPYPQGEAVPVSHSWDSRGTYEVKARARDIHGAESEWSNILMVKIKFISSVEQCEVQVQVCNPLAV